MEIRAGDADLIGYIFSLEDMVIIKGALNNTHVKAFIQTHKTNFITQHLMTPLLDIQSKGPNFEFNMALEEAYLKGVLDLAAALLEDIVLPGQSDSASTGAS